MALIESMQIAAAGMRAQGDRLRVVAENIANADSTSTKPGGEPYRRKTLTFQNSLDKELGLQTVSVSKRGYDMSAFTKKYDPSHPAADAQGYVQYSNVNPLVEAVDMREANRAYQANIDVIGVTKSMLTQTIQLLSK